ncbi:MAG: AAA family ATPase [Syntrophobacterales bacterium]|jgi:hypothetical protein|nr:AAA family ATPase [Syntrophobacterales bacterium]
MEEEREEIELNPEFQQALELMENTGRNIFITGRAGTGKSTLLAYFCRHTRKRVAVLAPTGVAAVNVGGQTIHSFCGFKPDVSLAKIKKKRFKPGQNIYKRVDAIIIDEVSMMRADLMDCVDRFLRLNGPDGALPFGGIQLILIGDLYQLPPVLGAKERGVFQLTYRTPYFFSSLVSGELQLAFVELEKIYRQTDPAFIQLLNAIRNRTATDNHLRLLNSRVQPDFDPSQGDFCISMTTTNDLADLINAERLERLPGKVKTVTGTIEGDFGREYLPTAEKLTFKNDAQVMLLNNDSRGRWVNGTIGRIVKFSESREIIRIELEDGEEVDVGPYTWHIFRLAVKDDQLVSEPVGSFTQYPFRLAFAVTIHKSQGKTFERVLIDVGRGVFAPGQIYVALSRCTSLAGIALRKPVQKNHVMVDWRVTEFLTACQYRMAAAVISREDKMRLLRQAIAANHDVTIVYLTAKNEKTKRVICPAVLGEMSHKGHPFTGLEAYCRLRNEKRVFNVDHILEIAAPEVDPVTDGP